jgi:hypothetical protein
MAKGQRKSNREIKKPKKAVAAKSAGPATSSVTSAFATPPKGGAKTKKK